MEDIHPCEGLTMLSWPAMVNHSSNMVGNVTVGDTDHSQTMLTWSCPGTVFTPSIAAFEPRNVCGRLNPIAYGILRLSQLRGGGGGIFIPHPRKQCDNYLIGLKFDTHN